MTNQRAQKTTIRDIARMCNVSTQTVSRVINNRPDVAEKTRAAVEQMIARMGYQPSAVARSLVQHILAGYYMRQRFTVGQLLTLDQTRGAVSNIGTVNTLVTTPDGDVVIPNSLLVESIVQSPRPPAPPAPPPPVAPPPAAPPPV